MQRLIDEGCLRDVDPELLVMQFVGPLLFWRQLHAIGARTRRHPQPPRVCARARRSVSQWRRRRSRPPFRHARRARTRAERMQ